MTILDAAILGLVQGLTEFLPVSSSGHLVLFGQLLGLEAAASDVLFDLILHLATLLAVVVVFARDLGRALAAGLRACLALPSRGLAAFGLGQPEAPGSEQEDAQLFLFVAVATLPTGLIGVLGKEWFESLFASPRLVAGALLITAAILLSTWPLRHRKGRTGLTLVDALVVGTVQGLAIVPGISRSGSTIAAALWRGIDAGRAARISFLMSLPAILGAVILEARHAVLSSLDLVAVGTGAAVAFVSGVIAILVVLRVLRWQGFWVFGLYCVVAGLAGLLWLT
ncbi:MAG: undecaprenyl-diphosphate phosphatase [Pseudomonadota bacterium]